MSENPADVIIFIRIFYLIPTEELFQYILLDHSNISFSVFKHKIMFLQRNNKMLLKITKNEKSVSHSKF